MKIEASLKEKLFTTDFLLVWVASFFAFTSFHLLLPILPLYVVRVGGTESQVGLVLGILAVTSVGVRTWIGRESDRRGKKIILVWGTLALVLSAFSYTVASTVVLLVVLRLFHGVAWAATTTPPPALIADMAPPGRRAEAMGWYGTGSSVAMAIAPLLAVFLNANYGFNPAFLAATAMAAIAMGTTLFVREPRKPVAPEAQVSATVPAGGSLWQTVLYRPALVPAIAALVVTLTYGSMLSFLPLLAYRHDLNPGVFFSVYAIFLIVSRPIGGKIADIAGRLAAVIPGTIAMAASLALLAFATDLPLFLVSAALYGIGFSFVHPALMAMITDRAAPEARGAAMGTFGAAFDLGIGLGAILLGLLLEKTNFQVLFLTCSAIALGSMVVYLVESRRMHGRGKLPDQGG